MTNEIRCECGRPARFRARGAKAKRYVHTDRRHPLCSRCFRDAGNAAAASRRKVLLRALPPFPTLSTLLAIAQLGEVARG